MKLICTSNPTGLMFTPLKIYETYPDVSVAGMHHMMDDDGHIKLIAEDDLRYYISFAYAFLDDAPSSYNINTWDHSTRYAHFMEFNYESPADEIGEGSSTDESFPGGKDK